MRCAIGIERAERNDAAYVPDVGGGGATGDTVEEVTAQIAEALAFHVAGLAEDGDPIPPATSLVATVEVTPPAGGRLATAGAE